jgi:diguanylate cyclase (GGDEF)-like protein
MQGKRKTAIAVLILIAILTSILFCYQHFVHEKIHEESSTHLSDTYTQVGKTFNLFSQRNWSLLSSWDNTLSYLTSSKDAASLWADLADAKNDWCFSDFALFNERCEYITVEGETGTLDDINAVFNELDNAGGSAICAYDSPNGTHKIIFALQLTEPFTYEGVTYSAIGITYDNDVLQRFIAENIFQDESDCYIVRSDGSVALALEPKTVFTENIDNIVDYLASNAAFGEGSAREIGEGLAVRSSGSAQIRYEGKTYGVVYQPLGINDWSLIAVVHDSATDSGMRQIRMVTVLTFVALGALIMALVIYLMMLKERGKLKLKEIEKGQLERQNELTNQLFSGINRVVDRFAIINLEDETYEYHDHSPNQSPYPSRGRYSDFLDAASKRCAVLTDDENVKFGTLLAPENLRDMLRSEKNLPKFEYCERNKDVYKVLNIIPLEFDDAGRVARVMFVAQDIGQKIELENIANTDGLTGLFNERYFNAVLHLMEQKDNKPYALLYLDLDRFKPVNDTYGHDVGDKLLKEVALRIQDCIRSSDYAFRIGGDEFAVIITGETDEAQCKEAIDRIAESLTQPYNIGDDELHVGCSCGWAIHPDESDDADQIRILADKRMYEEKERHHTGR